MTAPDLQIDRHLAATWMRIALEVDVLFGVRPSHRH